MENPGEEIPRATPDEPDFSETNFKKWPEEKERYDEITEYMRQVDEILDFIKPFPRTVPTVNQNSLNRSLSTDNSPKIDHLENLIKLVEQLKDLKDKNSKIQERSQYLKDLKKLHERKKRLKYEAELEIKRSLWSFEPAKTDETSKKSKSSLPFRKNSRGRSKSVNIEERSVVPFRRDRFPSQEQERKSSGLFQKTNKAKVSKWTKVKEAFRWEKASHSLMEPRGSKVKKEDVQYLQVPNDKTSESLSDSALSGQISGSSSVGAPSTSCLVAVSSGYSGEHSSEGHSTSSGYCLDLLPPPPPAPPPPPDEDFLSLIQDLSSSSSSEKLDELLTYSELLSKGNGRSGSTADSIDVSFHRLDLRREDEIETRRSKSLDGDIILGPSSSLVQHFSKDSLTSSKLPKTHKTPWGKVKDIIQTRKGSLKKKSKKRAADDFRRGAEIFSVSADHDVEVPEDLSSPDEKPKDSIFLSKPRIEVTADPAGEQTSAPAQECVATRRLTPVLTITLPSTEELRNLSFSNSDSADCKKPQTPIIDERNRSIGQQQICQAEYFEDIPKYEKEKINPYHRRFSRWTKVKRAFLTSTSPTRSPEYTPGPNSVPSSPNKHSSFFSDIESDELSSGEWTEDKIHCLDKTGNVELESPTTREAFLQADIQKSYLELQQKLTREFDEKIREIEKTKSIDLSGGGKQDESFQKQKMEDWDRIPRVSARQRESMAIPLPTMDDLSPEFKKKLDEWKKIKKSQTTPAVPHALSKDENHGQHFKMRIGEWQRWRPRSSHKTTGYKQETSLPDEFCKKLEEWEKMKGGDRRSRSQSDRGKDESGNRTPSPRLSRKNSKGAIKKITSSGKSSGTESLSGSLREKEGRGMSRKAQKEKDLQWLEKELHKIEREKLRLEREKEKYLEREARLEQMKRTMGTTSPTQEVLIQTPTGFFRFEGISQKFTKKLYEWEKARGIAPEASTFALLEEWAKRNTNGARDEGRGNGTSLQRSKSMGSVVEGSSTSLVQNIPHHPSSLSLNDVDELEALNETERIDDSKASSEPTLAGNDEDEPQAIIVDVEDVVVETAALMADVPVVQGEVPVYSYAPEEVTQLIDSSGSEFETEIRAEKKEAKEDDNVENSSAQLIDRNIDLLDELEVKETICRKLENDLENIEARMNDEKKSRTDSESLDDLDDRLIRDGERLQHSFAKHSEQQENLARSLVDNMKLLDATTSSMNQQETVGRVHELSSHLLHLAEALETALTDRNDDVKNSRNAMYNGRERPAANRLHTGQLWFSADETALSSRYLADHEALMKTLNTMPSDDEAAQFPSVITNKVLELKCGLNILKNATEIRPTNVDEQKTSAMKEYGEEELRDSVKFGALFSSQFLNEGAKTSGAEESDDNLNSRTATTSTLTTGNKNYGNGNENKENSPTIIPFEEEEEKVIGLEKSKVQIVYGESAALEYEKNSKQMKNSPDVIKRKIKEKISLMQRMTTEARPRIFKPLEFNYNKRVDDDNTDDESPDVRIGEFDPVKKNGKGGSKQRKTSKTRRITDAYENRTSSEKEDSDDVFLKDDYDKKYPIYIHLERKKSDESGPRSSTDVESTSSASNPPPVNVFVPTTRKIISPVKRDNNGTTSVVGYVIDDVKGEEGVVADETAAEKFSPSRKVKLNGTQSASPGTNRKIPEENKDIGMPPLPNSPNASRKSSCKEAAPSIRMMIAKYNKKMEDVTNDGSGSSSPITWRSPVLERRVHVQGDGTNVLKHGGKFSREVQKSASAGLIRSPETLSRNASNESLSEQNLKGILKSSSVGTFKTLNKPLEIPKNEVSSIAEADESTLSESALRALRIKRAKEEFLMRGPGGQSWTSEMSRLTPTPPVKDFSWDFDKSPEEKLKNRLSHVSVGSESSFDEASVASESNNLIKSASAGMIDVEQRELLRRCSEGAREESEKKTHGESKTSKFGIWSIKSRFRKVRMRKSKEGNKMNTVSALCRQSLYLDVTQNAQSMPCTSKSCPSSPVLERSKSKTEDARSWIRNPARKIFKTRENKEPK